MAYHLRFRFRPGWLPLFIFWLAIPISSTTGRPLKPIKRRPEVDFGGVALSNITGFPAGFSLPASYPSSVELDDISYLFWRGLVDWPAGFGGVIGFFLLFGLLCPGFYPNPELISNSQGVLGFVDVVLGIAFCLAGVGLEEKLFGRKYGAEVFPLLPIFWGFIFQIVSGLYRMIAGIFMKDPHKWKLYMTLWFIPLAISLLSPFAFAAGVPSFVLVIVWLLKLKEGAGAWNPNRIQNQVPEFQYYAPITARDSERGPGVVPGNVTPSPTPSKQKEGTRVSAVAAGPK